MKKLLITTIFMFTAFSLNAQWFVQNSGITATLYDVEFINLYTGWAVSDGGYVLKQLMR